MYKDIFVMAVLVGVVLAREMLQLLVSVNDSTGWSGAGLGDFPALGVRQEISHQFREHHTHIEIYKNIFGMGVLVGVVLVLEMLQLLVSVKRYLNSLENIIHI
jgi:hypothetical protein